MSSTTSIQPQIFLPTILIIGVRGMGSAIAQRIGSGHLIYLADNSSESLQETSNILSLRGHKVQTQEVDVSSYESVKNLAQKISSSGHPLETIVHCAGLGPQAASNASRIYEINLLGTANVIEAFLPIMPPGSSMICIASSAGHSFRFSPEVEKHLARSPRDELISGCEAIDLSTDTPQKAYGLSKRGNIARVQHAAVAYGERGVRINSISPGIIATHQGRMELEAEGNGHLRRMVEESPMGRIGSVDDIAEAAAFLASRGASFVTGTDILIDGGLIAMMQRKR